MFQTKLKGVGAATLDRGISIVIGSVILAGIVSGVNWLYNVQKKDAFINDFNVMSAGIKSYYGDRYTAVNLAYVKKAGNVPASFDTSSVGGVVMTAQPTFLNFPQEVLDTISTSKPYGWKAEFTGLDYDLCVTSGSERVTGMKYIYGGTTATTYYAKDLPVNDSSQRASWEAFCDSNAAAGSVLSYVFQ